MASAHDELTNLKMRAAKKEGAKLITIINHTKRVKHTCSLTDGVRLLARLVETNHAEDSIHIVDHASERKRKADNPTNSTRVVFDSGSPGFYKRFHAQRQRYYDLAKDMGIAMEMVLWALESRTDKDILDQINEGSEPDEPEWIRS